MTISIIIPTLNEEAHLPRLLEHLKATGAEEILVSDGKSVDGTRNIAATAKAELVECGKRSRAIQMNAAADKSRGEVLYFVHADTLPPATWKQDVLQAIRDGHGIGGYRFKFDSPRPLLALNSFFTRFNKRYFRGGDQSMFITRELFDRLGGYCPEMRIMEEYDLMDRAEAAGHPFHLMKGATLVSARKYEENGYLQVQRANLKAMRDYRKGLPSEEIQKNYHRMLKHPKAH